MPLEPIGDPDEAPGSDFADEHEQTVVEPDDESDDKESESPKTYSGGMDDDGPP